VQVLEGLAPGDRVVTSGQFLLDAESRMREAIQKHLNERLLAGADRKGTVPDTAPSTDDSNSVHSMAATLPAPAVSDSTGNSQSSPPSDGSGSAGREDIDELFEEYLKIQKVLGAPQLGANRLDVGRLVQAAKKYADAATGKAQPTSRTVADAAAAMQGKSIEEQRQLFGRLSDAVVSLGDLSPPSRSVADRLYVAYCPMAFNNKGGQWLQAGETIENPYYATEMKRCGEVKRKIESVPAPR
jgi:hypothetical protein